jgi:hypothetical protein
MSPKTPNLMRSAWILLGGLALSWGLVVLIVLRHPGDLSSLRTRVLYGAIATVVLLLSAVLVVFLGARGRTAQDAADTDVGVIVGLVAGCGWILEIGFNNFVDHRLATGPARFVVDNSVWGAHRPADPDCLLFEVPAHRAVRVRPSRRAVDRSLGHLVVLGLAMGALLGAVGGLIPLLPEFVGRRS